jgi:UDP-3-O-[3-hydroxymyristoyl] N-acetylglucosamine deacetylase
VKQHTIAEKVSCTGVGLHSGVPVQVTLLPARAHRGIVFVRNDLSPRVEIPARPQAVRSTRLATTLGHGDATVGTVEHLLSALYGLGVDNIRVGVDGPELPVMDGSAASFVYLIRSAGIFAQREARRVLRLRRRVEVCDGERRISVEPSRSFQVSYAVEFEHPAIGRQELHQRSLDPDRFERELSASRTFGFLREVDAMWNSGLARGGWLDNTVVLDERGVVNAEGLRWPDEFVRHKVLDLFGDLALLGVPIQGHVRVERGGHSLHQKLISALLTNPEAWWIHDPDSRGSLEPARSRRAVARASAGR